MGSVVLRTPTTQLRIVVWSWYVGGRGCGYSEKRVVRPFRLQQPAINEYFHGGSNKDPVMPSIVETCDVG